MIIFYHDVIDLKTAVHDFDMEVVGHQGPCMATGPALSQNGAQPLEEIVPVAVVAKNPAPLDASRDDMVQCSRCVQSSLSWHTVQIAGGMFVVKR